MAVRVAVVGASGRMGSLAVALVEREDDLALHAAIGSSDSLDAMIGADVVIDFTVPGQSQHVVETALSHGLPTIIGTSGWSSDRIASLRRIVDEDAGFGVLVVPNFSLGSVVASTLAATAARFFDSIEIIEAHHAGKVDSPSGTAVRTAELMGEARADLGPVSATHSDQRARGQRVASIPIHSVRLRGIVAKQDVLFGGDGEVLTIAHETLSPQAYERGILLAIGSIASVRGVIVGLDSLLGIAGFRADTATSTL